RRADETKRAPKLRQRPRDSFRLAAERIEPGFVEIGGGEGGVAHWNEPPGAVIEAFAADVQIVGVEHAMNEPRRHPATREPRICLHSLAKQRRHARFAA